MLQRGVRSLCRAEVTTAMSGRRWLLAPRPFRPSVASLSSSPRTSSSSPSRPPTAVVMLNMGGPGSLDGERDGVHAFLSNLFSDGEIITLGPLQSVLGPYIAKRRAPKIREQYAKIGGKSPIRHWTDVQGAELVRKLDVLSPETAPHKHYIAFRYAPPFTEDALDAMAADGVTRAVAFSQYPHYSCTTTGSSLNHLWRSLRARGAESAFTWSVLDRWPTHPTYVRALARRVELGLAEFPPEERSQVVVVFTAHSIPMRIVHRGDPYTQEIAATVQAVMESEALRPRGHKYLLAWQSKVGFLPWMGPSTSEVIDGLGRQGHRNVLAVPVAFTSDHIETLYEIDIEYKEEAAAAGIARFVRAPALNDEDLLTTAQAELVRDHLRAQAPSTSQYPLNCAGCTNPTCRSILNPVGGTYRKLRDSYGTPSSVPTWP